MKKSRIQPPVSCLDLAVVDDKSIGSSSGTFGVVVDPNWAIGNGDGWVFDLVLDGWEFALAEDSTILWNKIS